MFNPRLLPAAVRHAYWSHHNRQIRPPSEPLGNTLKHMLEGGFGRRLRWQAHVVEILTAHLPPELLNEISIGPLRRGMLTLYVSAAATAYDLQQRLADRLAREINPSPGPEIKTIRFAVGSPRPSRH